MDEQTIITVEPEIRLGVLAIKTPDDMVRRASEVATSLARVVDDKKLYSVINGKKFVHVEGWATLGAMLGIVAREVPGSVIEHDNGDFEASVELIRVSDGRPIGFGSALCGCDEVDRNGKSTWGNRAKYARRSMSVTRAAGKAFRLSLSWIMKLAGYEPTPAEEMQDDPVPKWEAPKTQAPIPSDGKEPANKSDKPLPKLAVIRYRPFITWAQEWALGDGKDKPGHPEYTKNGNPDINHVMARVALLGFAEVTEQNIPDVQAALESYVKGNVDIAQQQQIPA